MEESKKKKLYETLVQNAVKGETYLLRVKNNERLMLAIPLIRSGVQGDDEKFSFQVLQPVELKGMYKMPINEIEMLEKVKQ